MFINESYGAYDTTIDVSHVDESYDVTEACGTLLVECERCMSDVTNALYAADWNEAKVESGVMESVVFEQALNEAAGGILTKLKDTCKKVFTKIKEIIQAVIVKIQSMFIKDGKELIRKYGKQVTTKVNLGKVSKMEYKWKKPTDTLRAKTGDHLKAEFNAAIAALQEMEGMAVKYGKVANGTVDYDGGLKGSDIQKVHDGKYVDKGDFEKDIRVYTEDQKEKIFETFAKQIVPTVVCSNASELKAEIKEAWFDDEETVEGVDSTKLDTIYATLSENKKTIHELEKAKSETDRANREATKAIEAVDKVCMKDAAKHDPKQTLNSKLAHVLAQRGTTQLTILGTVSSTTFAAYIECYKEEFSQARRVFLKVLNYGKDDNKLDESVLDQINSEECDLVEAGMLVGTVLEFN